MARTPRAIAAMLASRPSRATLCPVTPRRLAPTRPPAEMAPPTTPRATPTGASSPVRVAARATRPTIRPRVANALTRTHRGAGSSTGTGRSTTVFSATGRSTTRSAAGSSATVRSTGRRSSIWAWRAGGLSVVWVSASSAVRLRCGMPSFATADLLVSTSSSVVTPGGYPARRTATPDNAGYARPAGGVPAQARPGAYPRAGAGELTRGGAWGHVRDPAAPRPAAALGPAGGAGRGTGGLGAAPRPAQGSGAESPGGAYRGPSDGVRGLLRRDPGGGVRGRPDDDLRSGHVHDREVAGPRGDRGAARRPVRRPVRPVPDPGRRLDDPPDGRAAAGLDPAARAARADAADPGGPAAGRRRGVRVRAGLAGRTGAGRDLRR